MGLGLRLGLGWGEGEGEGDGLLGVPGKMTKLCTCPGSRVLPLTTSSKKRVPEP